MSNLNSTKLKRCQRFSGTVRMTASKSIANRVLLLSALISETTEIRNLPILPAIQPQIPQDFSKGSSAYAGPSKTLIKTPLPTNTKTAPMLPDNDILVTIQALRALGLRAKTEGDSVIVSGQKNAQGLLTLLHPDQSRYIFVHNAGTVMRMLSAILCAGQGVFVLDGDSYMRQRPIGDLVKALLANGVNISCENDNFPPVEIHAGGLNGGEIRISGERSSQFLSGLLMASPLARSSTHIVVSGSLASSEYVHLTLKVMEAFGVRVERSEAQQFLVEPQEYISPAQKPFYVEGDVSSASYFFAAGALPNGSVSIEGIHPATAQPDIGFLDILTRMGAHVHHEEPDTINVCNPQATPLRGVDVDMYSMPDAALTLAVLAVFATSPTIIRRIGHLRYKESDRLNGLLQELKKTEAQVRVENDALIVIPPSSLSQRKAQDMGNIRRPMDRLDPLEIETYGDHRMVMAFSLLAFGFDVSLQNPECVGKSYPSFFEDWKKIMVMPSSDVDCVSR